MQGIDYPLNDKVLVDFKGNDDAGVYLLTPELALVHTLDFITPVVNDPYLFGQIAAANSLSDIFAMGARVQTALNIVTYDSCHLSHQDLTWILKGGADKVREAGGVVLGGHTIMDLEMKYGLAVTGLVDPRKIIRNNTVRPGDRLILTKPLGIGVITTALKADMASPEAVEEATTVMTTLNKMAAEQAVSTGISAMTDITGFGLIGHLSEMLSIDYSAIIHYSQIPILTAAYELADMGLFPGGTIRNRNFYKKLVALQNNFLDEAEIMLLYDAQTSGGLLISVPAGKAEKLVDDIRTTGYEECAIIGEIIPSRPEKIIIV